MIGTIGLRVILVAAAILATAAAKPPKTGSEAPSARTAAADLVLLHGIVHTVDRDDTKVGAVAVRDGKIVFAGDDEGAAVYVGDATRVIDLRGRLVLPGFIDSHFHVGSAAGRLFDLNLRGLPVTRRAYAEAVEKYAREHPGANVIRGRGWSEAAFAGIGPRKEWLDEVVSDRPVILSSDGGHSTWVNSRALEMAGITAETPDPEGGVIERDPESGQPSGTLREAAGGLIASVDPGDFSVDQYERGLRWMQETILGPLGITGVFNAGGSVGSNLYAAVEKLARGGEMTFWLRGAYTARPSYDTGAWLRKAAAERRRFASRHFRITAIKFFEDGVIEGHTALLLEPYADAGQHGRKRGFRGPRIWRPEALEAAVTAAYRHGFQTHHHAIADRSVAEALDAIAMARQAAGRSFPDPRDGITHLTLVAPPDLGRFADLGVLAVPQPQWFLKDDYYHDVFVPFLGRERADRAYPMKSFFDAGVVVASSSDWGVTEPPDPLRGIQTAVMRLYPIPPFGGRVPSEVLWPAERIPVLQAIRSYTINGAYGNFLEKERGSIEAGKYADLIVLDRNILDIDPSGIGESRVVLTLFEGREVYRHPSFDAADVSRGR